MNDGRVKQILALWHHFWLLPWTLGSSPRLSGLVFAQVFEVVVAVEFSGVAALAGRQKQTRLSPSDLIRGSIVATNERWLPGANDRFLASFLASTMYSRVKPESDSEGWVALCEPIHREVQSKPDTSGSSPRVTTLLVIGAER